MRGQAHLSQAESIVKRLQEAHYTAFFAGGWVRDFIMGRPSQDIDIATSAHPEEVMKLFPRSIAVGAQFGVVRVLADGHEFEVATFRSDTQYIDGRRPVHVHLHSSPEEDAQRRDFTINGLFYDPIHQKIYDFIGGQEDIRDRVIRAIGCPLSRFKEDRLRMIRAIRFKNTLQFSLDRATWQAICAESCHIAPAVSPERIWQELTKMKEKGVLAPSLRDMWDCGLLSAIFPVLKQCKHGVIEERLTMVQNYSGASLAAALCLLFQEDQSSYLDAFVEGYRLSRKEKRVVDLFQIYGMFHRRLSTAAYVRLYALPEWEDYAAAVATARRDASGFLRRHKKAAEELSFWITQVQTNSYLVTGGDLKKRGIHPGVEMGRLLGQAFTLSVKLRLKDKEKILRALLG
jgi:poly(A) polymerase